MLMITPIGATLLFHADVMFSFLSFFFLVRKKHNFWGVLRVNSTCLLLSFGYYSKWYRILCKGCHWICLKSLEKGLEKDFKDKSMMASKTQLSVELGASSGDVPGA